MKKFIFLIIITTILGCQNTISPQQPKLEEEFIIKLGQEIAIPEENISLQFNAVLEESRCPEDATCIWAGNAKIAIQLNKQEKDLNTYVEPKQAAIANYEIKLISLNPYPKYNKQIRKKDYVAKLLVTKN